jgi:hypothetical protein
MADYAGTILASSAIAVLQGVNPLHFIVCDGRYIPGWQYPDYRRRCGAKNGAGGIDRYKLPISPGYSVRVIDDARATAPAPGGPTVDNPPPYFSLTLDPVADVTTATGTATVTAVGHMAYGTYTCMCRVISAGWSSPTVAAAPLLPDGTVNISLSAVPVGTGYHVHAWISQRPDLMADSNTFQVLAG